MELKGKRVLVFGAGISGIGAARLLFLKGAVPVLYDSNPKLTREDVERKLSSQAQAEIELGPLTDQLICSLDLVVLSPGVPTDLPDVKRLKAAGLAIWGEVELAYVLSRGQVLAITGTNGKTTTTSLLGEIMKYHSRQKTRPETEQVFVVGNIGTAYTGAAPEMTPGSVAVAEISSFQLETIDTFHPRVSAITNITPDHLDRHHTMEEYVRVKELITKNQDENDTCVLNYEDPYLRPFGEQLCIPVLFFSSDRVLENGLCLEGDRIVLRKDGESTPLVGVKELKLLGKHNYENVMTAAGMALAFGVPLEEIRHVLRLFTAVEHRIEYVATKGGVAYYNDSKGTNPDAAIRGIKAMERPTVLIGGGYDKGASYEEWIRSFDGKVRKLVLIGQTREKIARCAAECGFTDTILADSFEEAFRICVDTARPGDAVLLSPACASWGMFSNYEERGRIFKNLVKSLPDQ